MFYASKFIMQLFQRIWKSKATLYSNIKIAPNYSSAHMNYANLLYNLKGYEKSIEHYLRALKIDFNNAYTHYNYANLLDNIWKNMKNRNNII